MADSFTRAKKAREETTPPGFSKLIRKDLSKKQGEKNCQSSVLGMEREEEVREERNQVRDLDFNSSVRPVRPIDPVLRLTLMTELLGSC